MDSSEPTSYFDILPNETIVKVFEFLDAQTLARVPLVCNRWNYVCIKMESFLWKIQCSISGRITSEYTQLAMEELAKKFGWKRSFFFITKDDISGFQKPQTLVEAIGSAVSHPLKKHFQLARGLELFPNSASICLEYADFLIERPDENGSWLIADEFYKKAIDLAIRVDSNRNHEQQPIEYQQSEWEQTHRILPFLFYRYATFLSTSMNNLEEADKYYKKLLRRLPGNVWVLERYAEFQSELCHKHNLAEKIYRLILNAAPSSSCLANYSMFLWQVRRNYLLAEKCMKSSCSSDIEKIYFYTNFCGRRLNEEKTKEFLEKQIQPYLEQNPEDEKLLFTIALAYHQIHCIDEAESMYRKQLAITKKPNIYTLSNLAELMTHSRFKFDEAEQLYRQALEINGGHHETAEMALAGLLLAQNRIAEGMSQLDSLLKSSYIRATRTTYTEGWILKYIHCSSPEDKAESLRNIKRQLVTEEIRPKLILMFDANLFWAKEHGVPNYEWICKISAVYNGECEIEELDEWEDWKSIECPLPPEDDDPKEIDRQLESLLSMEPEDVDGDHYHYHHQEEHNNNNNNNEEEEEEEPIQHQEVDNAEV